MHVSATALHAAAAPAAARRVLAVGVDGSTTKPSAQHCSSWHGGEEEQACRGVQHANLKQKRNVRLLAGLTGKEGPDAERMSFTEADQWIAARWREWMAR